MKGRQAGGRLAGFSIWFKVCCVCVNHRELFLGTKKQFSKRLTVNRTPGQAMRYGQWSMVYVFYRPK